MTEIVKVDPAEFGIEETKAKDIASQFQPMLDKMVELEQEFNSVIALPIDSPESAIKAKELRLKYVKVRTGTAEIHKKQKAFYLLAGRYIDGWKNAQEFASNGLEERLAKIEKHAEIKEKQRIQALQEERALALVPFQVENTEALNLGHMSTEVWNSFLLGTKTNFEAKKAAEKKAEEERIAKEQAEAKRLAEQQKENERLRKEAEQKEALLKKEREAAAIKQKQLEDKIKADRFAAEKAQQVIRDKAESAEKKQAAKLQAETEKRLKLEKEIQAKKDKEAADLKEKEAAEKKLKRAPDKTKLKDLAAKFENFKTSLCECEVKSDEAKKIVEDSKVLLGKIVTFINEKTNEI